MEAPISPFQPLLPLSPARLLIGAVTITETSVVITLATTATAARCPVCGQPSGRVHSHYPRILADLPIAGIPVQLRIAARRFFCRTRGCLRKIFVERLHGLAPVAARRTSRLGAHLRDIALADGGKAGARLARRLGMVTGGDTLLRLVRQAPAREEPRPRVVGVDEWAKRRGRSYGSIVVDLEEHRVVDLLEEATPEAFAQWLLAHPGVEVIARDRSGAFADGGRQGAPGAIQVADRWHLFKNVGDAVEAFLKSLPRHLLTVAPAPSEDPVLVVTPAPPPPERRPNFRERDKIRRREARRQRYDEVLELVRQGVSGRGIERRLGISRETVRRYVQAGAFPEIASRAKGPSILDPFRPYLEQRWDEGCRKGQVLLQELQARGYRGGNTLVAGAIAELRRATKALAIPTVAPAKKKAPPPRPLAPRSVRWWFARDPDDLTAEEKRDLNHVCTRCAEAQAVYELAQRFGRMVRERRPEDLAAWLDDARSGPRELRTLAGGLERDRAAVEAALTLEWSNGQTEGQINRLKLIKRKAFGRANFDLLRQRVLEAA